MANNRIQALFPARIAILIGQHTHATIPKLVSILNTSGGGQYSQTSLLNKLTKQNLLSDLYEVDFEDRYSLTTEGRFYVNTLLTELRLAVNGSLAAKSLLNLRSITPATAILLLLEKSPEPQDYLEISNTLEIPHKDTRAKLSDLLEENSVYIPDTKVKHKARSKFKIAEQGLEKLSIWREWIVQRVLQL